MLVVVGECGRCLSVNEIEFTRDFLKGPLVSSGEFADLKHADSSAFDTGLAVEHAAVVTIRTVVLIM